MKKISKSRQEKHDFLLYLVDIDIHVCLTAIQFKTSCATWFLTAEHLLICVHLYTCILSISRYLGTQSYSNFLILIFVSEYDIRDKVMLWLKR